MNLQLKLHVRLQTQTLHMVLSYVLYIEMETGEIAEKLAFWGIFPSNAGESPGREMYRGTNS